MSNPCRIPPPLSSSSGDCRRATRRKPFREIINPLLWLYPLIHVFMPCEHHLNAILQEERFQYRPQLRRRAVKRSRRVQGMMKITEFPVRSRGGEFFLQPLQLLAVKVIAVQREKMNVAFLEG